MNPISPAFFQNIRQRIADGDLPEALRLLRSLLDNSPRLDEAIQQSGRYQEICSQVRLGAVSQEDASVTKNQIRWGLLELLRNMERQGDFQALSPLLDEIGRQAEKPQLREEMAKAVSIVNSKNVVTGSSITAGGNVTIGDNTIVQNAEKIYNIDKIDNAKFS